MVRRLRPGLMLRRIFAAFGGFAFQSEPGKGALTVINCRIWDQHTSRRTQIWWDKSDGGTAASGARTGGETGKTVKETQR